MRLGLNLGYQAAWTTAADHLAERKAKVKLFMHQRERETDRVAERVR